MDFSVISGRIQMERFIPVENFRKKVIPFEAFPFSRFYWNSQKFLYHFVLSYSSRLFTIILTRKNAKDLKDGGRCPKRLSLQCDSLLVGCVGGRFRTQLQHCGWKRITFCGRYLCFSFTWMIRDSGVFPPELHRGKKCGCWLLGSRTNCRCCSSQKKKLSPSSPKTNNFLSRPIKRLARQEVQPPCFLLTWYVPRPRPTGIWKFRSNDTVQSISFP